MDNAIRYLDLLKRALTNTVYEPEPDLSDADPAGALQRFVKHYIRGHALSMLSIARLNNIQSCIETVIRDDISGDLIEAGVWRGGAAIFMRGVLAAFGVSGRTVWVADSFEGLPAPDPGRFPVEARAHNEKIMRDVYRHFRVSLEDVKHNFAQFGLLDDHVAFVPGWFRETLASLPARALAVLRIDADYYDSTMDALVYLYDRLSVGGYTIVDDYGETRWTSCREAVDDFRRRKEIRDPLIAIDSKCYFWRRSG